MNDATRDGCENSRAESSSVISGKAGLLLALELFGACRAGLLASHPEIAAKKLTAECTALLGRFGSQALENVVSKPHGALIEPESDVAAAHRDPAELFSLNQQPSVGLEWHEVAGRSFLRE